MPTKFRTSVVALALGFCLIGGAFAQSPARQSASGTEAEREGVRETTDNWLKAIDSGNIASGWQALSRSTTARVDQPKWQGAIAKMRTDFGAPKGREFRKATLFKSTADGAEPDAYLVEYDSVSAERGALHEIVRVVKDDDGTWRVAGYTVGPKHQGGDDNDED